MAQTSPAPICRVCNKQFSQYTCPRCNLRYCSLACYRSHSHACLHSFMRDNVLAEMRILSPSSQSKRRMMEALKRLHTDDDHAMHSDDGDMENEAHGSSTLSETTLHKIAAGEHVEFDDLTQEERKSFLRAVASGKLSHMIRPWDPWWLNPSARTLSLTASGNYLVQPVNDEKKGELEGCDESDGCNIPAPPESPLPCVKQLTSVQPSPLLRIHLAEVVYGYCFTLRLFNGDWHADSLDAAITCLTISQVLGSGEPPESLSGVLGSCIAAVSSPFFRSAGGRKFGLALLDDVLDVMYLGRPGIICLLADLYRMLKSAESFKEGCRRGTKVSGGTVKLQEKTDKGGLTGLKKPLSRIERMDQKRLQNACRKVYFLTCWANEQVTDVFSSLALLIEGEKTGLIGLDEEMPNGSLLGTTKASNSSHVSSEKIESDHNKKGLAEEL